MTENIVFFAHGKESGPWGEKITRLARIARDKGFLVESPDYSKMMDPDERVKFLLQLNPQTQGRLVLVGSSMGGYVSAVASKTLMPDGLFLMAPAFFRTGYEYPFVKPQARICHIVHGWGDELIAADNIISFAREYRISLSLLDSDHRLISAMPFIEGLFAKMLDDILKLS